MKKIKQKTKRKIVLAVCVLAAALVIVLIVQGVRGLFYKKADTSAGLEYIHGEEKGDIAAIEKKIELLEKKRRRRRRRGTESERKVYGRGYRGRLYYGRIYRI